MSVSATATMRRRPYPNPQGDPRLPVAIWYMQGAVAGDASGGTRTVQIVLNAAGATRTGRSWSIETCEIEDSHNADQDAIIFSQNTDVIGPGLTNPIQQSFSQIIRSDGFGSPACATQADHLHPRIYIGAQGASANPAAVSAVLINRDGETMGVYMSGYEWGPEVINLGALKPADGLI